MYIALHMRRMAGACSEPIDSRCPLVLIGFGTSLDSSDAAVEVFVEV